MDSAALVPGTLETPLEGFHESGVLVADPHLHAGQAAAFQAGEEPAPERLVLAVAHVGAQDFPGAVGGDPSGDDDGHGHDLPGGVADVEVGGVEIDVGELNVTQRVRNAPTISSSPAQIRDTSDFEMPASTPIASTRSSTARVEMPCT